MTSTLSRDEKERGEDGMVSMMIRGIWAGWLFPFVGWMRYASGVDYKMGGLQTGTPTGVCWEGCVCDNFFYSQRKAMSIEKSVVSRRSVTEAYLGPSEFT